MSSMSYIHVIHPCHTSVSSSLASIFHRETGATEHVRAMASSSQNWESTLPEASPVKLREDEGADYYKQFAEALMQPPSGQGTQDFLGKKMKSLNIFPKPYQDKAGGIRHPSPRASRKTQVMKSFHDLAWIIEIQRGCLPVWKGNRAHQPCRT